MKQRILAAPRNSVILIMDPSMGEVPESMDGLVAATSSCVAIGTVAEPDGETSITLSDNAEDSSNQVHPPVVDRVLMIPTKRIGVYSVAHERFLEMATCAEMTRVRIWVNHPIEPDDIDVVAG